MRPCACIATEPFRLCRYLEEKAKKKAIWTVYGIKQKVDAQPTRSIFLAFDQAIQLLQVKPLSFLTKKPVISGFAENHPRFGPKPKKEVKDSHELLEDWVKALERKGHPALQGSRSLPSWGIPFATWTSQYNCNIMKTSRDCETIAYYQQDPGRLLHAFVCRGIANLSDGQILLLLPGTPAESLLCWLEGLPGFTHKIITWQDLDAATFEGKLSKSLRKQIGRYPLPCQYAIRDPKASSRSGLASTSSPNVLEHPNTVSPPPYSTAERVVELGHPDPREMPATNITDTPTTLTQSVSLPAHATPGLKSIHALRRKSSSIPKLDGQPPAAVVSQRSAQEATDAPTMTELPAAETTDAQELPAEPAIRTELPTNFNSIARKPLRPQSAKKEAGKTSPVAEDVDVPTIVVAEPTEIDADNIDKKESTATDNDAATEKADEPKPSNQDEVAQQETKGTDFYIGVLRRVADGDLTPEALKKMFEDRELP
jgi:hypothetical protein